MTTITYRANDAVLTVCQDNGRKSIEVSDLNTEAEKIFGFGRDEVVGSPLSLFMPDRVNNLIRDYVEYEDEAKDLGSVLGKVSGFTMRSRDGKEIPVRLKIVRGESRDRNAHFNLIMQDETQIRKEEAFHDVLRENFKGHEVLEDRTGLPNRESVIKDLELVHYYVGSRNMNACFAVMELDNYESLMTRFGNEECSHIQRQIAIMCRQKLRSEDTVGSLGLSQLGFILLDIPNDSARMVLNRLRWLVASVPLKLASGNEAAVSVSVAFSSIGSFTGNEALMTECDRLLSAARSKGGNTILEAVP